jgi:DNA-binding response OmpR family regulator
MNGTILIADDDPVFVELLSSRLRNDGFEVQVAFDSVQAMTLAMRQRLDAVLLDMKMPGGNGLDTLKRLKRSSRTHGIPVIVASALDDPALAQSVRELGAVDFLQKPVLYETVLACLGKHLRQALPAA